MSLSKTAAAMQGDALHRCAIALYQILTFVLSSPAPRSSVKVESGKRSHVWYMYGKFALLYWLVCLYNNEQYTTQYIQLYHYFLATIFILSQ